MNAPRWILALPTALLLSAAVSAADVALPDGYTTVDPTKAAPAEGMPCVQGYPSPLTAGGQACLNGGGHGADCDCDTCGGGSWWSRTTRGIRQHWFRYWQKQKHLQHPEAPPFFEANWGYHPTCWRRFPPICDPCPLFGPSGYAPAVEGNPPQKQPLPPAPEAPK
jgi:hypothetical protein